MTHLSIGKYWHSSTTSHLKGRFIQMAISGDYLGRLAKVSQTALHMLSLTRLIAWKYGEGSLILDMLTCLNFGPTYLPNIPFIAVTATANANQLARIKEFLCTRPGSITVHETVNRKNLNPTLAIDVVITI